MNWTRRRVLAAAGRVGLGGAILPWATGCIKPVTVTGNPSTPPIPTTGTTGPASLKARASAKGLFFGCAVATELLGVDAAYERLVREQCSIVVAENAMKWGPLRPAIREFHFEEADRFVAFAEANQMRARGHNLCWHRQLPKWFETHATKGNASKLLTEHIQKVAGRYAGRIHSWDVVNEAVLPKDGRPDGLRKSPWLELIGTDYVDLAFRTAREADPKALLTYNDYGIEAEDQDSAAKRKSVLELVRGMKTRGVPIDAVGVQSHIGATDSYGAGLSDFMASVRQMGLEIFVTEMDVNDRKLLAEPSVIDREVARQYGDYLALVVKDSCVKAVLTWGITDRNTWLNSEDAREDHLPERCLPFDREFKPVDAFYAMRQAFDRAPSRSQNAAVPAQRNGVRSS